VVSMADVVYIGGGMPAQAPATSSGNWTQTLKELLPIGVVIAAAWLLWPYISAFLSGQSGSSGGTAGFGSGTNTMTQTPTGSATVNPLVSALKAITTPGTYVTTPGGTPQQGSGIGNLFVNTGPGTPNNLFPLGDVITTSRILSTSEQQQVLTNLANQPYLGWWSTPAQNAAAAQTNPGGINTGGSSQSNIPAGTTHTECTSSDYASGLNGCRAPGTLGPNDGGSTWY